MRKPFVLLVCVLIIVYTAAKAQPLYGLTSGGGGHDAGTLFYFNAGSGTLITRLDFDTTAGVHPTGSLVEAVDAKLYGAAQGGAYNKGILFSFDPLTTTYKKLWDFNGSNGNVPTGSLIQAKDGKLYGTTTYGGIYDKGDSASGGVIFSFDPSTNNFKKLYDFDGLSGRLPQSGLIQATDGKLYGVTPDGGENDDGVIFSFDPATVTFSIMIDFAWTDDSSPCCGLLQAKDGLLYGTTRSGFGFYFGPGWDNINGLFELLNIGEPPSGLLLQTSDGKLYGMTVAGNEMSRYGALFSYDFGPEQLNELFDFDSTNGAYPAGKLLQAADGKLYGAASAGGAGNSGVLFSYDLATATFKKLTEFNGKNGAQPTGSLTEYNPCPTTFWYLDTDRDGYGSEGADSLAGCTHPDGYASKKGDCNDHNPAIHPGAKGRCNGVDDDCDGLVDEDCTGPVWYRDADGDGWGNPNDSTHYPTQLKGYVSNKLDCDDKNKTSGGPEVCDGRDNDCDGVIDNGFDLKPFYSDFDGDGYGTPKRVKMACSAPPSYVANNGDCNDDNATVYPGASELCDGRDNDCNGKIDDGLTLKPFYWDGDKDGYGFVRPVYACAAPPGYISTGGDCNDNNPNFHPGVIDVPGNIVDEDCNGLVAGPSGALSFYSVTSYGGSKDDGTLFYFDTVIEKAATLSDFKAATGSHPSSGMIQVSDGKLYGMATNGGSFSVGTIFSFNPPTATYTKLWEFDYINGANPVGGLLQATNGKLYGTTYYGDATGSDGASNGFLFSFDLTAGAFTRLWDFDGDNGGWPNNSLTEASDRKLYGTTALYGGTIFSFDPATGTFKKLWDFGNTPAISPSGKLIQALDGKLYGTTQESNLPPYFAGTLYSFDPATATFKELWQFDSENGAHPQGGLVQASDGKLYGTTFNGGIGSEEANGTGVLFSFDPATGVYKKLVNFIGVNGANPSGELIQASDGKLYGTAGGGLYNRGVVFSFDLTTQTFTKLADLDSTNGIGPIGLVEYKPCTPTTWYRDKDSDSYGNAAVSLSACTQPQGYVRQKGDCNDNDAAIHPDADGNGCNAVVNKTGEGIATQNSSKETREQQAIALHLKAVPNPSQHYFTLFIESNSNAPVQLRVLDAVGRTIEVKSSVASNTSIMVGHSYRPGVYYIQAVQDKTRTSLKLVKHAP